MNDVQVFIPEYLSSVNDVFLVGISYKHFLYKWCLSAYISFTKVKRTDNIKTQTLWLKLT